MPKSHSNRKRRTKAQWTETLRRFESSGLDTREFCRREDLSLSSFQRWRRQLGSADTAGFVELVPTENELTSKWSLNVSLPNGVCLRFEG